MDWNPTQSQSAAAIEKQSVELTVLDELVDEFIAYQNATAPETTIPKSPSSHQSRGDRFLSTYKQHLLDLQEISTLIQQGDLFASITRLEAIAPALLLANESYLLFELKRQHFIELLRSEKSNEALQWYQQQLRPFESSSFAARCKDLMLLLMYKDHPNDHTPLSAEWDIKTREDLANAVVKSLKRHWKLREPLLTLLMRYLVLIQNMYCALHGEVSQAEADTSSFLLSEREPQSPTTISQENAIFVDDRTCDSLAQLVGIAPNEARSALELAQGSLEDALLNELGRIQYNQAQLRHWCLEYQVYRDLDDDTGPSENVSAETEIMKQRLKQLKTLRINMQQPSPTSTLETGAADVQQVVKTVLSLDPSFADHQPFIYFSLKRLEFQECVRNQQFERAMAIARSDLASLSLKYPQLAESIKEVALLLLFPQQNNQPHAVTALWRDTTLPTLATPVYMALAAYLGVQETKIIFLFRHLLYYHTAWYQQECSEDPFAACLMLDRLKRKGDQLVSPQAAPAQEKSLLEEFKTELYNESDVQQAEKNADDAGLEEEDIGLLRDMLACSRVEAILFLLQNGGDVSQALAGIFGS